MQAPDQTDVHGHIGEWARASMYLHIRADEQALISMSFGSARAEFTYTHSVLKLLNLPSSLTLPLKEEHGY